MPPSPPHEAHLRETYVTLDRVSEYVEGVDAWAVERVQRAIEAELNDAEEAKADQLVRAMHQAAMEADS